MDFQLPPLIIEWYFPTCQVRVVRFSSSSTFSSSSSLSSSFSSTTFASTPMFTSALPTLLQTLRQLLHAVGTAGPQLQGSESTGHRWTSTWDLPSSVSTAGPQPGTVRAQWAPGKSLKFHSCPQQVQHFDEVQKRQTKPVWSERQLPKMPLGDSVLMFTWRFFSTTK